MTTLADLAVKISLQGAGGVRASLRDLKTDLRGVGEGAKAAGANIQAHLTDKLHALGGAARNAVMGLGALGVATAGLVAAQGVKASLAYTELNARLEAVTGSADAAARKLKFAQEVANPSNFTFSQLAEATTTLEAFGVHAERALPTVARLGMAFGADNEKLQMLVRGLGDLSSGSFPEKDVLASFGLNRDMFAEKGIKFDGSGQLLSSATETFTALEKIVTERYGNIFEKIGSTPGAKLASLSDSWEKLIRVIGDGILTVAAPALERLSTLINGLTNSGVIKDVMDSLVSGMSKVGGIFEGDGMVRAVANILSVLANLPDAIKKVGDYIGTLFQTIADNAVAVIDHISRKLGGGGVNVGQGGSAAITDSATGGFSSGKFGMGDFGSGGDFSGGKPKLMLGGLDFFYQLGAQAGDRSRENKVIRQPGESIFDQFHRLGAQQAKKDQGEGLTLKEMPSFPQLDMLSKAEEYYNRIKAAMKPTSSDVPAATGNWLNRIKSNEATDKPTEILKRIETNTGKTYDALSLRRQSFGGGPLAALGATPAEMSGGAPVSMGRPAMSSGQSFDSVGSEIAQIIKKAVDSQVRAVVSRQGAGGYPR